MVCQRPTERRRCRAPPTVDGRLSCGRLWSEAGSCGVASVVRFAAFPCSGVAPSSSAYEAPSDQDRLVRPGPAHKSPRRTRCGQAPVRPSDLGPFGALCPPGVRLEQDWAPVRATIADMRFISPTPAVRLRCCCARSAVLVARPTAADSDGGGARGDVRRRLGISAQVARLYEEAAVATQQYEAGRREAEAQKAKAQRLEAAARPGAAADRGAERGPRPDRARPVPRGRRAAVHRADAVRRRSGGADAGSAGRLAGRSGRQQRYDKSRRAEARLAADEAEGRGGVAGAGAAERPNSPRSSRRSSRSSKRRGGRSRGRLTRRSRPVPAGEPSGSTSRTAGPRAGGSRLWRRTNSPRASAAAVNAGPAGTPGRTSRYRSARRCGPSGPGGW